MWRQGSNNETYIYIFLREGGGELSLTCVMWDDLFELER